MVLMPFYDTRHVIKPGLTGWAQVNYAYGANIDDSLIKLQYDLYYIKHKFLSRFEYCAKTITVLFYRGNSSDSFFFFILGWPMFVVQIGLYI
jgi:lipopolysaccharide/colanic/teichoic acid biosynthesis glycosyltransferase